VASFVVNTVLQAFLEVLHRSLQHGGKNCCHFVLMLCLTFSLLMSHMYGAPSKARNLKYIYGRDFLLGILLLEPCISLIYALKTNRYTNYSFSLLIMHGSAYIFRHYIAIPRERSECLLRDAQLRDSRQNIVEGRGVSSDVVRGDLRLPLYRLLLN
jgi:hypothetical protein